VTFNRVGQADFAALRLIAGQANAILIAYDLLELDEQDIRREPLRDRRKGLERLLRQPKEGQGSPDRRQRDCAERGNHREGRADVSRACRMGLEGIVSKRLGSSYTSGRSRHWLKRKTSIRAPLKWRRVAALLCAP
jgi:bifunctional non-homologous end joining protein LigD